MSKLCVSALICSRVFYEASRDLDSQPPPRTDHVEASRPRGLCAFLIVAPELPDQAAMPGLPGRPLSEVSRVRRPSRSEVASKSLQEGGSSAATFRGYGF